MNLLAHRRAGKPWWSVAALLAVSATCALVLALPDSRRPGGTTAALQEDRSQSLAVPTTGARGADRPFTVLQMNLCLSGLADCYDRAAYPDVVREAVARIRAADPTAVTFNEACRRDTARIARRTGYRLRFSRVNYLGTPLRCISPGGRGLFGNAVLTKARVVATDDRAFKAQIGIEERRWLCVTTRRELDVCTAHLSTRRTTNTAATNDAQCAELAAQLARRSAAREVAFGGDVNRHRSCAPDGVWTRTDRAADQAPGLQHVYGSADALRAPSATVRRTRHSDHDVLLVRARLVPGL